MSAAVLLLATGAPVYRNYVYAAIMRTGAAPTWADLSRDFMLDRGEVAAVLDGLAAAHDVVLLPGASGAASRSYILMAHPFSNLPTAHRAIHDRQALADAVAILANSLPASAQGGCLAGGQAPPRTLYGN